MFTYFLSGEDKSHRLRRISVETRPAPLEANFAHNAKKPPEALQRTESACSLLPEDTCCAVAANEQLCLLNGGVNQSKVLSHGASACGAEP